MHFLRIAGWVQHVNIRENVSRNTWYLTGVQLASSLTGEISGTQKKRIFYTMRRFPSVDTVRFLNFFVVIFCLFLNFFNLYKW